MEMEVGRFLIPDFWEEEGKRSKGDNPTWLESLQIDWKSHWNPTDLIGVVELDSVWREIARERAG